MLRSLLTERLSKRPQPGNAPPCGFTRFGPGSLAGSALSIDKLAQTLSRMVGRTVNKSDLSGTFDVNLNYTRDESQLPTIDSPHSPPPMPPALDPSNSSLFTALQEQLGLKLEPQRGPVEIFVIDRAEKPSQN